MANAAVASSGPIIQGSGVRSLTQTSAATKASSKVTATRATGWRRREASGESMEKVRRPLWGHRVRSEPISNGQQTDGKRTKGWWR